MRKMQAAIACAASFLITSVACVGQPASPSYSHAELRKMISEAHTAEQYQTLATYFSSREISCEQKAAVEKQEWLRLRPVYATLNQKYPRPADASKNRYEYFAYKAQQMNERATHYEDLAASATQ
jgi:hypothetical protein